MSDMSDICPAKRVPIHYAIAAKSADCERMQAHKRKTLSNHLPVDLVGLVEQYFSLADLNIVHTTNLCSWELGPVSWSKYDFARLTYSFCRFVLADYQKVVGYYAFGWRTPEPNFGSQPIPDDYSILNLLESAIEETMTDLHFDNPEYKNGDFMDPDLNSRLYKLDSLGSIEAIDTSVNQIMVRTIREIDQFNTPVDFWNNTDLQKCILVDRRWASSWADFVFNTHWPHLFGKPAMPREFFSESAIYYSNADTDTDSFIKGGIVTKRGRVLPKGKEESRD